MSARASKAQRDEARSRFTKDTQDHQMTVLLDQGVYRHIRFAQPGSSTYAYTLTTFPGSLVVAGDMGEWVFSRLHDMFEFFRGDGINPSYWAEKLDAAPCKGGGDGHTEADDELTAALIWREALRCRRRIERSNLPDAVREEVREDAIQAFKDLRASVVGNGEDGFRCLYEFTFRWSKYMRDGNDLQFTFGIDDVWDNVLRRYTFHYLWILYAIVRGIAQYDASKAPASASAAEVPT